MAAVLACGPKAVLSHTSAAGLWGIEPSWARSSQASSLPAISHVTVPGEAKSRKGIRVHRSQTLFPSGVTRRAGIPVTTRGGGGPRSSLLRSGRRSTWAGLPLDPVLHPDHTRSELEARFLALCRRHRLSQPGVNQRVASYVVDFLWPEHGLIVELDGYESHGGRSAFEADRSRDAELKLLGYDVVRFTWRRIKTEPAAVASMLRRLLLRADWGGEPSRAARSQ